MPKRLPCGYSNFKTNSSVSMEFLLQLLSIQLSLFIDELVANDSVALLVLWIECCCNILQGD